MLKNNNNNDEVNFQWPYLYDQPGQTAGQLPGAEVPCLGGTAAGIWSPQHQRLKTVVVKER